MGKKKFQQLDPQDFVDEIGTLLLRKAVTYVSATLTVGTVPANSVITRVIIPRVTAWDAITTFQVGKSGNTNWLVDTTAANVTGAAGGAEVVTVGEYVTSDTDIVLTLNQGAASAGSGYVLIEYVELAL